MEGSLDGERVGTHSNRKGNPGKAESSYYFPVKGVGFRLAPHGQDLVVYAYLQQSKTNQS